jgi:hypothetical protein
VIALIGAVPGLAAAQQPEIATTIAFTEGPAVDRDGNVYFTDMVSQRIMRLTAKGVMSTFRERSNNANGLLIVALGIASSALMAQGGTSTVPDAVTADHNHYSVSFENELVRVLRVRYGPGEKSVMHSHTANCSVFLTDQTFNFTIPDGTTEPASVGAGQLGCGDANVHLPENIRPDAAEFIMFEFKNRQRFRQ